MTISNKIEVLDFGGQYAHLIARRFRNLGYFAEISEPDSEKTKLQNAAAIVLSGGPSSVNDKNAPKFNTDILSLDIPILGLCYGHQILLKEYGGKVTKSKIGEFGLAILNKNIDSQLLSNVEFPTQVWMSHHDEVVELPKGFRTTASTKDCINAVIENVEKKRYSLQFHAEVKDTDAGMTILNNFANIAGINKNWNSSMMLSSIKARVIKEVGEKKVLLFLSGGVDSSVAFVLLSELLGKDNVLGLYINNGFMRKNETQIIAKRYKDAGYTNFIVEDASDIFLEAIKGLTDPQKKRLSVGETFLKVRDSVLKKMNLNEEEWLLAQGTLYPDIIESGGSKHADVIKTHHNRVEGIKQLLEKGLVIEPLKDLYKDEVRELGKKLGVPKEIINRHPFPGPGLSINVLCSNGEQKNKEAFTSVINTLHSIDLSKYFEQDYDLTALPVKSVGVQGDFRTYNYPAVINRKNFFNSFQNWNKYEKVSSLITNSIKAVNRVVCQIYQKNQCKLIRGYCTKDRLDMLREVDKIVLDELKENSKYNFVFQHLSILLPYASSKNRASVVLRPVVSEDVMTARFYKMDIDLLEKITNKIVNLDFIDALFYDITNKPPATFGWE